MLPIDNILMRDALYNRFDPQLMALRASILKSQTPSRGRETDPVYGTGLMEAGATEVKYIEGR